MIIICHSGLPHNIFHSTNIIINVVISSIEIMGGLAWSTCPPCVTALCSTALHVKCRKVECICRGGTELGIRLPGNFMKLAEYLINVSSCSYIGGCSR